MTIANQAGAAFRADLNNMAAAIATQSSGPTAPTTTYAYQQWADTTSGYLKKRNAANSAWITDGSLATGITAAVQSQTYSAFPTTGTAAAYVFTPVPAITAYVAPQRFRAAFHVAGNGSSTVNINGLGALNLKQYDSTGAKVAAAIAGGQLADMEYDGVDLVVLNPLPAFAGSGKVIANLFTATRTVVAVSGDTTVMTLNFTLTASTPVVVDWRTWFGVVSASTCYGNARVMLGAIQKARSSMMHVGSSGAGYTYNLSFNGSASMGTLVAGSYTISIVWTNVGAASAVFNTGPADSAPWPQSDSEIIIRAAY